MAAKLTPRMIQSLTNAAGNQGGHYLSNINQGGGTPGALFRRGLVEQYEHGFRITDAGRAALDAATKH